MTLGKVAELPRSSQGRYRKGDIMLTSNWVPVLTSESGLCLTASNWQEAKINTVVYYLDALLLKPGLSLLKKLPNLAGYVNWPGELIINASRLKANKLGEITLKSTYDGSKITLEYQQIIDVINHLKPKAIILPEDILKHYQQLEDVLDSSITAYFNSKNLPSTSLKHGIYFQVENNFTEIIEQLEKHKNVPCYVQGALSLSQLKGLTGLSVSYIESELPSDQGLNAFVYADDEVVDLKDSMHALSFTELSTQCQCSTCSAKLTRAYLHHLYAHTPLLAQRFLIQHNAHFVQNLVHSSC